MQALLVCKGSFSPVFLVALHMFREQRGLCFVFAHAPLASDKNLLAPVCGRQECAGLMETEAFSVFFVASCWLNGLTW